MTMKIADLEEREPIRKVSDNHRNIAAGRSSVPLWVFSAVFLIHIGEEYRAVGLPHGLHMTSERFLVLTGAAWIAAVLCLLLTWRSALDERMRLCLATVFFINAWSHLLHSLWSFSYDPGLITGMIMFFPLGAYTLWKMHGRMKRPRFLKTITVGIAIHAVVTIVAL